MVLLLSVFGVIIVYYLTPLLLRLLTKVKSHVDTS